jgi:hypothetical protein
MFSTPFYAIVCLARHQISHRSWQNDFGQGFSLALKGLGFIIIYSDFLSASASNPTISAIFCKMRP